MMSYRRLARRSSLGSESLLAARSANTRFYAGDLDPSEAGSVCLSPTQRAEYCRDGFVRIPSIAPLSDIARVREIYDAFFLEKRGWETGDFFETAGDFEAAAPVLPQMNWLSRHEPSLLRSCVHRNALATARDLLGPNAELVWEFAMMKPASSAARRQRTRTRRSSRNRLTTAMHSRSGSRSRTLTAKMAAWNMFPEASLDRCIRIKASEATRGRMDSRRSLPSARTSTLCRYLPAMPLSIIPGHCILPGEISVRARGGPISWNLPYGRSMNCCSKITPGTLPSKPRVPHGSETVRLIYRPRSSACAGSRSASRARWPRVSGRPRSTAPLRVRRSLAGKTASDTRPARQNVP